MIEKILPLFSQYFTPSDTLIVGVSGGPDSTALLDMLVKFSRQIPLKIFVAHVNHGLRGKDALHDEKFVKTLSKSYGLKCIVKRVKLAGESHIEEHGRKIRREFFEKLREKFHARWILTAHTEDDQLETIIFHFLRGSGPGGLAGMKMIDGFYFKPFLSFSKKEILTYLKSKKKNYCRDRTNDSMRFSRNFIRKKILPLFEKINPSFRKTLLRNSELFRDIDNWLCQAANHFLEKYERGHPFRFDRKDFLSLPQAVQKTILQRAFQRFTQKPYRLSALRIRQIMGIIERNIGKKKIPLGGKGYFFIDKGQISIVDF